jgi:transcriptional regulator with XRE-family HTH domain
MSRTDLDLPALPDLPIVHVSTMGNMANQMIQYMVALSLASRVGRCVLSQVGLPDWNIHHPPVPGEFRTEIVTTPQPDLDRLAAALQDGTLQRVDIRTYGQRMENFLAASVYRGVFVHQGRAVRGAGPDELLCSIRQGDVLDGHHPDYVLIPIDFYEEVARATGLRLVFAGQLENSPYMAELRARFPEAKFLPSRGAIADFERIRRSVNILPSVSTFAWLAAWLSEAAQIFLPVLGLFHPLQSRSTNLLPLGDPRVRFYLFPFHYAVPVERFAAAHDSIRGLWRYVDHLRLVELLRPAPRPRHLHRYLEHFDEAFYLAAYPDIAAAVQDGHLPSGRHHFEHYGFPEGREAFFIDKSWYCQTYPIAAIELSQGEYDDAHQHWLDIGRARGYRPAP